MENKIGIVISEITRSAGTERAVINLANNLICKKDCSVYIISVYSSPSDKLFYVLDDRVKVIHLNNPQKKGTLSRSIMYFTLRKQILSIISKERINVIIGTTHAYNIILASIKKGKVSRIGCEHLNYYSCPSLMRALRRIMYKKLDAVVLLTQRDAKHYNFVPQKKVYVIPNIASFERGEKAALENHKIIMVGRLTPQKGYDIMLDIIHSIKNKMSDWTVCVFGTGEDREMIETRIKEYNLNNRIQINEPVDNIKAQMLDSSIYLMTSRNEGLPMVLIEAQTCGLPIVAFDCPEGPSEIIKDTYNGFLVPMSDYKQMSDRITELISNKQLRKTIGQNAYDSSIRFSAKNIILSWETLFSHLGGDC